MLYIFETELHISKCVASSPSIHFSLAQTLASFKVQLISAHFTNKCTSLIASASGSIDHHPCIQHFYIIESRTLHLYIYSCSYIDFNIYILIYRNKLMIYKMENGKDSPTLIGDVDSDQINDGVMNQSGTSFQVMVCHYSTFFNI